MKTDEFDKKFDHIMSEAWRQWTDFKDDRNDCTIEDYHLFVIEIKEQLAEQLENEN